MMESTAKGYQRDVLKNALEIFRWTEAQLQLADDEVSRRAASSHNGCILLKAPTGAGKTRMAGMLAEEFSNTAAHRNNARIVWFWFTPFAGLVEQASLSLRESFPGLRVRSLADDRVVRGTRSGDLYVTTWAAVTASNQETRRIRTSGDVSLSFDEFLVQLRSEGFRIGVVVDEAHHGFFTAPLALELYHDIMQPDFTLLITATPDDRDVELFRKGAGITELHRIRVSRKDAVDAGLIKEGIKSIAYLAPEDQKALVDFPLTALGDGWRTHTAISQELRKQEIDLVPLMLVQVGNSDSAVADARERLISIGVPEETIASYTSMEPKDDLLTVALDETKQVLIFKVAVALGFDAPRAFTLVSLRGSKDTNFGIQVVGRILRVHPRLQGRMLADTLPRLLRFGYVFLSDADNQQGLTAAGEKINGIRTELSEICPFTMVVNIAGRSEVQVIQNGQTSLLPSTWRPAPTLEKQANDDVLTLQPEQPAQYRQADLLGDFLLDFSPAQPERTANRADNRADTADTDKRHSIKPGIERVYQTEMMPLSTDALVQCISACIDFSAEVLAAGRRESVRLVRRETDVFENEEISDGTIHARLSEDEITRRAQGTLFDAEHLDPRTLYAALLARLATEYEHRGWDAKPGELEKALNLIMVSFPSLLRKAERKCNAEHKQLVPAAPLPEFVSATPGMVASKRNIYGVMPLDLNQEERELASLLDADTSDTVEWWWRNEVRKPWSIALVLPTGDRYFPDFVVKVRGRSRGDGILLIEYKGRHILNGDDTLEKVAAEHKIYKKPLMITRSETGKFMVVEHDPALAKNQPGQAFRIESMVGY